MMKYSFSNVDTKKNEKRSAGLKVTNEEVPGRVNEDRQILNSIWKRKHRWLAMF